MILKRLFDGLFAGAGIVLSLPLLIVIAVGIKVDSRGPVLFRQIRVGRGGRLFSIIKFRTMQVRKHNGSAITTNGDRRVTRVGRILRATKLDELPQLFNVLKGDMSIVGPRPEVPNFVSYYTDEERRVLHIRPGITDLASLHYRNESDLIPSGVDVEKFYVEHILHSKLHLSLTYMNHMNFRNDMKIILKTVATIFKKLPPQFNDTSAANIVVTNQVSNTFDNVRSSTTHS